MRRQAPDGAALLRQGRIAEAEVALARDLATSTRSRTHLQAGYVALLRGDLAAAESRLGEALRRRRRSRAASALLAEVAYRRGEMARASEHLRAVGALPQADKLASLGEDGYVIAGPEVTEVAFERAEPLPVVPARVNDHPPARFLLDTGGGELILDARCAETIGITSRGGERGWFAGGKTARTAHAVVSAFSLGATEVRGVPAITMDVAAMGSAVEEPELAGVIGTCLLHRFVATVDYPRARLVLRRRGGTVTHGAGAMTVPFLHAGDHFMLAEGRLNDADAAWWFVDTGLAGGAFTAPRSTLRASRIRRSGAVQDGQGGGGGVRVWPFPIRSLEMGVARREGLEGLGGAFPRQLERAFGFRVAGLVSHGFLDAWALTIDPDRMVLVLDPPSGQGHAEGTAPSA